MAETSTTTNFNGNSNRRFIKRPDDSAVNKQVDALRAEIKKLDLTSNELANQIKKVQVDQKVYDKRNALQAQLKTIIAKQSTLKNERNTINEQIKGIDQQMKKKITEIQHATSKHSFKNVHEIDQRIASLDKLVDNGDLKLAEERRYVKEMSSLRKLRKDFEGVEKIQALIDADKTKIADLKAKISKLQNKQIQEEFETIQKELDEINSKNKTTLTKKTELINKRDSIRAEKKEKYDEINKLRSDLDAQFAKFKQAMADEQKKRDEEYKNKRAEDKKRELKELADKQLADAAIPAFSEEISTIHNLLAYFDPSYVKPAPKTGLNNGSKLTANHNIRTVEMPSDVVIIKKEQEDFFAGSRGKKATKGKKSKAKKFTVDPEIIISLSDLSIPFPPTEEDVPETVKILKETLTALEDKQEEQTKINIEKAKARVEKLKEQASEEESDEE
ncbi:uncharacterized protein CANTADRAFT_26520 [Suhomyces tanzawaensis NRRL Y-17324]|uniref:Nuclear segregation protein n=1 Tax=Suhomyces tanzawaensis NRRL Y-17324 TaxID=984487 RepID=A0A1E4SFW3_9ASCO|nr:uncharacterized protein CANTADRAFT_26520 [Suhomyces tanzawaensis NRRL Y-17324]ODV78397.1 hypothetical protein CANTADRAFT_26520 [Suhomyces tanzawaensis NRRL Y-17324]